MSSLAALRLLLAFDLTVAICIVVGLLADSIRIPPPHWPAHLTRTRKPSSKER